MKDVFGDVLDLVALVRSWGINEVTFVDTSDSKSIPRALKLPFMLGRVGILYGKK